MAIRVTRRERAVLEHLLRQGRTGLWLAARAQAVLLAARGQPIAGIARQVGRDRKWVRRWVDRFVRDRLAGLQDAPRSGRPARFSPRRAA
jgi:transposase